MAVVPLLWWPSWTGYATDSRHATAQAKQAFLAQHGPFMVEVRAVYQVGV